MRNFLRACSALAAVLAAGAAFAGGEDHFVAPAPPPPPPPVEYFNGLNIGVFGSFEQVIFDNEVDYFDPIFTGSDIHSEPNGDDATGYGGVQATFGKVFYDAYYIGINGYGKFGEAEDTSEILDNTNGLVLASTEGKLNTVAGVNLKPGIVLGADRRTLVYIKGGAAWGDIEVNSDVFTGDSVSDEEWELGWLAGLGAERFVDEAGNFSVNVEYTYTYFDDVDANGGDNDDNSGIIDQARTKVRDSSLILGINYYPGFSI